MPHPLAQTHQQFFSEINAKWDNDIIPKLCEYIKIPNKSPMFDSQWQQHGYMQQAMDLIVAWCKQQPIKNLKLEVVQLENRTPLLFIEIPGQTEETVLLYGHMDKQPEMVGWDEDKGPWLPVLKGDKLYGRGGADDGYAVFASLTAIAQLQKHHIAHARCVIIIEGCEESGSYDLPFYLEHLATRIGEPSLVVCLDTGCGNYEQLWSCSSLRGLVGGTLTIEVLKEGIHSGLGSGIVPSTEMVLRQLLDRIEDANTGEIIHDAFKVTIPPHRLAEAKHTAKQLGDLIYAEYPFAGKTQPVTMDTTELLLNRTWRAQLSITGIEGAPSIENAGNVTLPKLTVKLSMRIPPSLSGKAAKEKLKEILETNPPFNANVHFAADQSAKGWDAPKLSEWLMQANERASQWFYGKPAAYIGEGGTIPFMSKLHKMFPQAQFLNCGVLGPKSNAHGPNEFLHIPMAKRLTACVASVIAEHYQHFI